MMLVAIGLAALPDPASAADAISSLKLSRLGAGTEAPPFVLASLDGTELISRSLRGKVVLLNFWATWCGPCKEEMPSLQRLQQQFASEDFAVVAITTDLQKAAIRSFMQQVGATFPTLLDEDNEVSRAFMVRGLPTTIVLGKDGKLLGRAVGPRAWDSPEAVALTKEMMREP